MTPRNELYAPTYHRRKEWAAGWEPPTRAIFACADASCLFNLIPFEADLPQHDPLSVGGEWHTVREMPKCSDGHRTRIIDVLHETIPSAT